MQSFTTLTHLRWVAILIAALFAAPAMADLTTYDFESVTPGLIGGQDNWVDPNGPDVVTVGTGVNTTQVLDWDGSAIALSRFNDVNYSFQYTDGDRNAVLQFDTLVDHNGSNDTARVYMDGGGSVSSWIGINSGNFEYRRGGTAFEGAVALTPFGGAGVAGDLFTLRMQMDFVGNTASVQYKNLTNGETAFTDVAGMQNLTLFDLPGSVSPSAWNRLLVRMDGGVDAREVDNISLENSAAGFPTVLKTYTFENLALGTLSGQDNWTGAADVNVATGTGVNTTNVVSASAGGVRGRVNDSNFNFEYDDNDTNAILQFDARVDSSSTNATSRFWVQGGGFTSPWIGLNGDMFEFRLGGTVASDVTHIEYAVADGGAPAGVVGDWFRIQLEMDFVNNIGSMFFMNLTDGDTTFTPIAGLQNIALFNLPGSTTPSGWNSLQLRYDLAGGRFADNLTVSSVPTPAALPAGLILLGFAAMRRRRA